MTRCATCAGPFAPRRANQRFCSKPCLKQFYRDSVEPCSVEECDRRRRAKGLCNTHYNRAFHAGSQRRCPGSPDRRRAQLRTRTQRRRALSRDPEADVIDRDKVGARDGWRCGICHRKIDRSLAYPDPESPSLDHIEPLSLGGRHVYENVRITHLSCNCTRGNQVGGEQLLLVG